VLIVAKEDSVILRATDGVLSIEKNIVAEVVEQGETVCQGKFLNEYTKKMSDGELEISTNDKNVMKIKYEDSVSKIQCLDAKEFPKSEVLSNAKSFEIKESDLKNLISKSIFATAQDDIRPILKGCLFEIKGGVVKSIGLDGFRLAVAKYPAISQSDEFSAVVPTKVLNEISKSLGNTENAIKVYFTKNHIYLELDGYKITSRLLSGDYIAYENVIPKSFANVLSVEREKFELALERVATLSKFSKNNLIKLDIGEETMLVCAESEFGSIKETLPISYNGKGLSICFNCKYFLDALGNVEDDIIRLSLNDQNKPCVITANQDSEYLFLILPIRSV
jgi:DNA polymerase-3 subunit beta